MEQLKLLPDAATPAPVFIAYFDADRRDDYLKLSARLRDAGISNEIYPDPKKLGAQLKYADGHGFQVALIAGGNEWQADKVQLKVLASGESREIAYSHDDPSERYQCVRPNSCKRRIIKVT